MAKMTTAQQLADDLARRGGPRKPSQAERTAAARRVQQNQGAPYRTATNTALQDRLASLPRPVNAVAQRPVQQQQRVPQRPMQPMQQPNRAFLPIVNNMGPQRPMPPQPQPMAQQGNNQAFLPIAARGPEPIPPFRPSNAYSTVQQHQPSKYPAIDALMELLRQLSQAPRRWDDSENPW
jgi:hypothetical protein